MKHKVGDLLVSRGILGQITKKINDDVYEVMWFTAVTRCTYLKAQIELFKINLEAYRENGCHIA